MPHLKRKRQITIVINGNTYSHLIAQGHSAMSATKLAHKC